MKSQDVTSFNLLPATFSTISFPDASAPLTYPTLPAPHLLPFNFFLNSSLLTPFLSTLPDQPLLNLPVSNSQSPFGSQVSTTSCAKFPQIFESSTECCSQSSDSSHATGSGTSSPRAPSPVRVSSVESCSTTTRIRRGRPQQEICDDDDPTSQKRRHRRLYARQYRAQMRHKIDEVKVLSAKLEEMQRTVERLEAALETERREHHHKTVLLNSMIQSKLLP
ncbi:hypothetical protein RB195_012558 [Necator americanus]|uniref:Uncharacterized protein n=2 Tax=Necator americanus TaxID=51031 RepID=W2TIM2_NECAM|nr:hypothetical protein NECAME_02261 [Necator americanus]ETN80862.1 hypothetical protein NECAME_02261 [Necator americanus]